MLTFRNFFYQVWWIFFALNKECPRLLWGTHNPCTIWMVLRIKPIAWSSNKNLFLMFAKHTSQHLWGLKVSGGLDYMSLCQKDTIFLKFFQNHAHALPRFFLLEPSRAHCLLLFQGTCHFLGCLVTIWVLVYPSPHPTGVWAQGQNLVSWLLVPSTWHWVEVQEAPTEGNRGPFPICDLSSHWPKSICKKPAGIHTQFTLHWWLASRTIWSSSDLKEEPLTKFVIWNHYEANKSSNVDPEPHLSQVGLGFASITRPIPCHFTADKIMFVRGDYKNFHMFTEYGYHTWLHAFSLQLVTQGPLEYDPPHLFSHTIAYIFLSHRKYAPLPCQSSSRSIQSSSLEGTSSYF